MSNRALQDFVGVQFHWYLGVSHPGALQQLWSGGLLFLKHVFGDLVLLARGETQQPRVE